MTSLWLPTTQKNLAPGDVVGIVGGRVVIINRKNIGSLEKIGVISSNPLLVGGYVENQQNHIRVTFSGIVKTFYRGQNPSEGNFAAVSLTKPKTVYGIKTISGFKKNEFASYLGRIISVNKESKSVEINLEPFQRGLFDYFNAMKRRSN